jgi:hypothetical protein
MGAPGFGFERAAALPRTACTVDRADLIEAVRLADDVAGPDRRVGEAPWKRLIAATIA